MDTIKQTSHTIEFISTYSPIKRFLFAIFAFVPLLAPFELLINRSWQGQLSIEWIIPLVISIVAVLFSMLGFWVALFGRGERFLFDSSKRQLTYQFREVFTVGQEIYSFDQIKSLAIEVFEHDEGPYTYYISVKIAGQPKRMTFGDFSSLSDAERYLNMLQTMLANSEYFHFL